MSGDDRRQREGCGFLSSAEVDALVEGRLADERREAFAAHLRAGCAPCELLAADLSTWRELAEEGVPSAAREEYRRGRAPRLPRARRRRPAWAALAAAAVLVLVAGVALHYQRGRGAVRGAVVSLPGGGEVTVAVPPLAPPPVLRGGPPARCPWDRVRAAWRAEDWAVARRILSGCATPDGAAAPWFYLGVADLLDGDPAAAREALERAREIGRSRGFATSATDWYLALARLGTGDVAGARRVLALLARGESGRAAAARRLLNRLGEGGAPGDGPGTRVDR